MTFPSGPWNGSLFDENDWRVLWESFGDKFIRVGTLTRSASTRTVSLSGSVALVQGVVATQSGTDSINVPVPSGSNRRIDYLTIKYDPVAQSLSLDLILGQAALSPSAPTVPQDRNGEWHMVVAQFGPYGAGAIAGAPWKDLRLSRGAMRSGNNLDDGWNRGSFSGDIFFTEDNIYRHTEGSLVPYFSDPPKSEQFGVPDSGWPKARTTTAGITMVTNQLTVPSRSWNRVLKIDAMHYLSYPADSDRYDSLLFVGSDSASRRFRHTRDTSVSDTSSGTLHDTVSLSAGRSLQIRLGMIRVSGSGAGSATSSAANSYNSINVLASPA